MVYVGRPFDFGNPYSHKENTLAQYRVSSAAEAVDRFAIWLETQPNLKERIRRELAGKDLVCWCREGAPCHARVLYFIANGFYPEEEPEVIEPILF